MAEQLNNPILSGFYPDPSICRVGKDFYMITSSFAVYPGIPIFHSTDLANWRQIGHVLDRPSQLHLTPDSLFGGIMAPTIRYHEGTFYCICTNFCDRGNFIVTATDPVGPWSEPHWIPDAQGIDPSLFFDDDGRCYFTGTRRRKNKDGSTGPQVIWMCEIDLDTLDPIGPQVDIWGGALVNADYPEAPHLYKRDGWYYLVIAEGGTEHYHSVTIARSRELFKPFIGHRGNPIMTHRHLGQNFPICNTGHADLVETEQGDWYAVMLASRLIGGYYKNLGRESFIVPVVWEDGWPVMSPGTGRVEWSYPAPELPASPRPSKLVRDDFDSDQLNMNWIFLGTPYQDFWTVGNSRLTLSLLERPMSPELEKISMEHPDEPDRTIPTLPFVGRRQTDISFLAQACMRFAAGGEHERAGLAIIQANNHQIRVEQTLKDGKQMVQAVLVTCDFNGLPMRPGFTSKTREAVLAEREIEGSELVIEIVQKGQDIQISTGQAEDALTILVDHVDGRLINPENVGGMIGTVLGMFATSNGKASINQAEFDWFDYKGLA